MVRLTDIDRLLCRGSLAAREVLARINAATPYLFQVIIDDAGRLLGTVTDGDIRRALLRGNSLDDPATACMHQYPSIGLLGDDDGNASKLHSLNIMKAFLPVVDEAGVVCEVLVPERSIEAMPVALVMAGGPGTRLGSRTHNTPKPLLTVADKPILEHVLTALEAGGITDIYVSVHYLAHKVEQFVTERHSRANVRILQESEALGTAGALANLPASPQSSVLVVNGDVLTRTNYNALMAFHGRHGHDATIAIARYEVNVPFGVVNYGPDGSFGRIQEKPSLTYYIAAGIYYLSPEFRALVPAGQHMDMPELLNLGRGIGLHIGLFPVHEYWLDVGRPEDLQSADLAHREKQE